jgi:hypothetical protein
MPQGVFLLIARRATLCVGLGVWGVGWGGGNSGRGGSGAAISAVCAAVVSMPQDICNVFLLIAW